MRLTVPRSSSGPHRSQLLTWRIRLSSCASPINSGTGRCRERRQELVQSLDRGIRGARVAEDQLLEDQAVERREHQPGEGLVALDAELHEAALGHAVVVLVQGADLTRELRPSSGLERELELVALRVRVLADQRADAFGERGQLTG